MLYNLVLFGMFLQDVWANFKRDHEDLPMLILIIWWILGLIDFVPALWWITSPNRMLKIWSPFIYLPMLFVFFAASTPQTIWLSYRLIRFVRHMWAGWLDFKSRGGKPKNGHDTAKWSDRE